MICTWGSPHIVRTAAVLLCAALFTSCPNPIPTTLASQVGDETGPVITLASPEEGATYQSTVTVSGTVVDADGAVTSCTLVVSESEVEEPIEIAEDGTFSAEFSTVGLTASVTLTLTAVDWNGNTATLSRTLQNSLSGPAISITEPADYSAYATVVRVSGTITDGPGRSTTGEVAQAAYAVSGTSVVGDLDLGEGGAFSFDFATRLADGTQVLSGSAVIQITATDWNGNESVETVTVVSPPTGDFGSFSVAPGNGQVTIAWDPVLYAESYVVRELNDGMERESVSSPFVWEELQNGVVYAFQIEADVADYMGPNAVSATVQKMPLSPRSLAPWVRDEGHKSISLAWHPMPGVSEYTVERSLSRTGPWGVRDRVADPHLDDTRVDHDTEYWYRVRASEYPDVVSDPVTGVPGRFGYEIVGSCHTSMPSYAIVVSDGFAYVVERLPFVGGAARLRILELTAADPVERGVYDSSGYVYDVAVSGSYAYLAAGSAGLEVVNVANPGAPYHAVTVATQGEAKGITLAGNHAFIASGDGGLEVFDVSTPADPQQVTFCDTGSETSSDVVVLGSYAYLGSWGAGVQILDIDPLDQTSVVDTWNTSTGGGPNNASDLYAGDSRIFLVGDHHIYSLAAYDGTGVEGTGPFVLPEYGVGIAVDGSVAYVASDPGGVQIVDVGDPGNPVVLGDCNTPGGARGVAVDGAHAYVAASESGVQVIDIATANAPTRIVAGMVEGAIGAADFHIVGEYAYVTTGDTLSVVELVGLPAESVVAGECSVAGDGIAIAGRYAYVATGTAGLTIVDLADPIAPIPVSSFSTGGITSDVVVTGPRAYVASSGSGLQILDISDAEAPVLLGACDDVPVSTQYRLTVSDGFAWVVGEGDTVHAIDVTDPANPTRYTWTASGLEPELVDVTVHGDYAYVADASGYVHILSITDPSSPAKVGEIAFPGLPVWGVAADDRYAYLGTDMPDLMVFDVHDPTDPLLSQLATASPGRKSVRVYGNRVYVLGGDALYGFSLWQEP